MATKKEKNEFSTKKSILILFVYLVIWWICLTIFSYSVNLEEGSIVYHAVNFLRIAVPIMTAIFGAPIILIVDYNKKNKLKKKSTNK